MKEKGIDIKEIGEFAVSPEGERISPKISFTHNGEKVKLNNLEYPVFRAKPQDVIDSIKI